MEDRTRYTAADVIALANNGVMHFLSNVMYELAGQEIECQQSRNSWCFNEYRKISLRLRVWNWTYPMLVTRNIGWSVEGKGIRETEGLYHREIRPPRLVQFCNRVGEYVWFLRGL